MDNKLIEIVKSHQILYDKSRRDFKDNMQKKKIWNHIGELLNTDGESVQRRWKVLRDRYTKERRDIASVASGASADCKGTWEFYAAMAFLDPYVKNRRTTGNIRIDRWNDNTDTESLLSPSPLLSPMEEEIISLPPETISEQHTCEPPASTIEPPATQSTSSIRPPATPSTSTFPTPAVHSPPATPSARKKSRKNQDSRVEAIDETLLSVSNYFKNKTEDDPDIAFGHYIGLQLKSLPARKKKLAKAKILNIVLELEEENE